MDQPKKTFVGQILSNGLQSAYKNSRLANKFKSKEDKERDVKNLLIKYIKQYIVKQRELNSNVLSHFVSDESEEDIVLDNKLELSVKKTNNVDKEYEDDIDSFLDVPLLNSDKPLTMATLAYQKGRFSTCRLENEIDRIVNGRIISVNKTTFDLDCSLPDGNPLKITKDITVSEYFEKLNSRFGRKSSKLSSGESILKLLVTTYEEKLLKLGQKKAESTTAEDTKDIEHQILTIETIVLTVNKVLEHKKYIPLTLMSVSQDFYYEEDIKELIENKRAWNACLEEVFGKSAAKVLSKKKITQLMRSDVDKSAITGDGSDFGFKTIIPRIVKENNKLFTGVSGSVPGIDETRFQTAINLVAYQSQTHYKSLLGQSFITVNTVSTGPDTTSVPKVTNYNYPHDYYVGKSADTLQRYTSGKMFYAGHAAGSYTMSGDKESIVFFIPGHSDDTKKVCFNDNGQAVAANASTSTELVYRSVLGGLAFQAGGKRLTKKGGKKGGKKARKTAKKAKKSKKC
jgi:hypothetical protein